MRARNAKICIMRPTSTPWSRAGLKVGIGVSLLVVLGLLTVAWQAGLFRPGCSAYLQSRREAGMLPPDATILRVDGIGDGHGAIALSGGIPEAFLISSPSLAPPTPPWVFLIPFIS